MIWLIGYVSTIVLANWAIQTFGVVPVGFGLMAPAGVLFAGLAFTLRDLTQDALGKWWAVAGIGGGALLSLAVSDSFVAVASGTAFLVSELSDMAVYTPLRRRHWIAAVFASNVVGTVVDSALFLMLAFGSLDFLAGNVVAKSYMTLGAVLVMWLVRSRRREWAAA